MAATEKAIKIAPKHDPEIKSKLTRKLNRHQKVKGDGLMSDTLVALSGVGLIFPCLFYASLLFIGTGFKAAVEGAVKMYQDGMKDVAKAVGR